MSTMLFGMIGDGVDADENVVRRNTYVVHADAPPAEAQGAPDWNELETDPNPELGMVGRQVASDFHGRVQYAPNWTDDSAVISGAEAQQQQIATSGTAAARERAGQFGHGTMEYAVGIEPVIRDGASYGADYFTANERTGIQPGADNTGAVQPALGLDRGDIAAAGAYGRGASRDASQAGDHVSLYDQFLGGN